MIANWNTIPPEMKQPKKFAKTKPFAWQPDSVEMHKWAKLFTGKDDLRPVMSGVNFDKNGIAATDAHKLFYIPKKTKYSGIFRLEKNNVITEITQLGQRYPNYLAVIPDGYDTQKQAFTRCKIDVIELHTFTSAAIQFANPTTKQVRYLYNSPQGKKNIGVNADYFLGLLEAAYKLGFNKLDLFLSEPNRALVFTAPGNMPKEAETFLVMPVMLNGDEENFGNFIGAADLAFEHEFRSIYNLSTGEILSADVDTQALNPNLSTDDLTVLKKVTASSIIPMCDLVSVKNNVATANNLETIVSITDSNLPDGLYAFTKSGSLISDNSQDQVDFPYGQIINHNYTEAFTLDIASNRAALVAATYCTGKDDLRPALKGMYFDAKKGTLSIAATDAYKLFTVDIPLKNNPKDANFIIPETAFFRWFFERYDTVKISGCDDALNVKFDFCNGVTVITRAIEEKYPDYKAIIPRDSEKSLTIAVKDVQQAVLETQKYKGENENGQTWGEVVFNDSAPNSYDILTEKYGYDGKGQRTENIQIIASKEIGTAQVKEDYSANNQGLLVMPLMSKNPSKYYFSPAVMRSLSTVFDVKSIVTGTFTTFKRAIFFAWPAKPNNKAKNYQRGKNATAPKAPEAPQTTDLDLEAEALELELQLLKL